MASTSLTLLDLPDNILDQIISNLDHDRHLEPLSLVSKTFLSITNHHKQTLKILNSTTQLLLRLLNRFPNLKHISFSEFPKYPLPILIQIADFDIRLETLDLSNHDDFPLQAFEKLPALMLNGLKSFKKRSRSYFPPHDLEIISYFFPNLEELDLSYPSLYDHSCMGFSYLDLSEWRYYHRRASSDHINSSVSNLKSLRRINFEGNDTRCMSDDVLITFSKNCPNLEEIVVKGCLNVTRNGVVFAFQACKNLKSIKLDRDHLQSYTGFDDDTLRWPRTLSKIRVSGDDDLLRCIIEDDLPLKSFTLLCCWGTTVSGIISFLQHYNSSLEYLSIKCAENDILLSDAAIAKYLTNLRSLKLSKCGTVSDSTLLDLIKHCPLLESVKLENTTLWSEDTSLKAKNVVNLAIRSLTLSNNANLSDESLKKIVLACPNLEMVRLSSCGEISSAGVGEIMRNCGGLKQLRIDRCSRVTSLDLDSKSSSHYKLETLVACEMRFNDKALVDIARKCRDLVSLDVKGCTRLTSSGVSEVFDKCTKLKKLNVSGCKKMSRHMVSWIVVNKPFLRLS